MIKIVAIIILTAFIFVYDLITPHGMSVSLLYLIPFSLSGMLTGKKFAFAFAGVTTALVVAGYFLAAAPTFPVVSEINRTLTVLAGWGILAGLMQRKRVLSELSEANARLKAIFDSSPNGIIVLDPEGNVLDWNRGAQDIFGYAPEEVKGRPYPIAPEDDYHTFKKDLDSALSGNTVQNIELSRKCKDGRMIHILHSHAPLRDTEGNIYGALGIFIDMTSMKRAEAEIEKANAMLKAIFECAPVAIIALDPDGKVLDWNRGAQDIFGYEAKEVIGRPYPIVAEEDADSLKKNLATLLGGKSIFNMELNRKRKDGKIIQALGSGAPLRDAKGYVVGALVTFFDLTEKKRAEADIERLNIEVTERKMIEQEREDLAAMITHDLKSPLTTIMLYTEMLIENRLEDAGVGLNSIRYNCEKVLGMIEDYLTVYRSHSGKLQLNMMPAEVADILRGLQKDFQPLAEKKGINLSFTFVDSPKAEIDKKQFGRAVSNLIQNAINYTPSGGRILVEPWRLPSATSPFPYVTPAPG